MNDLRTLEQLIFAITAAEIILAIVGFFIAIVVAVWMINDEEKR